MDEKAILARINALLDIPWDRARERSLPAEVFQGAVTLLEAVHGKGCEQISTLKNRIASIEKVDRYTPLSTFEAAKGSLRALKAEIESGIVGSLTRTITGEVLGDFIGLSRVSLEEGGEASKNVAAVLAAAAFEETIRRMGAAFAGIVDRDDLSKIIVELKQQGILQGSQVGVVQSHLQFRNDALHADWNKIDHVAVSTALQLVQHLLLKHFS